MTDAFLGFSGNGMLPVTAAAVGSSTLAMLVLGLVLAAAALTLVGFATGWRRGPRRARGPRGVYRLEARGGGRQRVRRPRCVVVTSRSAP